MRPRIEASKVLTKTEHGPQSWRAGLAGTSLVQMKKLFPAGAAMAFFSAILLS